MASAHLDVTTCARKPGPYSPRSTTLAGAGAFKSSLPHAGQWRASGDTRCRTSRVGACWALSAARSRRFARAACVRDASASGLGDSPLSSSATGAASPPCGRRRAAPARPSSTPATSSARAAPRLPPATGRNGPGEARGAPGAHSALSAFAPPPGLQEAARPGGVQAGGRRTSATSRPSSSIANWVASNCTAFVSASTRGSRKRPVSSRL